MTREIVERSTSPGTPLTPSSPHCLRPRTRRGCWSRSCTSTGGRGPARLRAQAGFPADTGAAREAATPSPEGRPRGRRWSVRGAAARGAPHALGLPPRARRRAQELGRAEGPEPRGGRAPHGGGDRRPPARVRRLRGRDPEGRVRGGHRRRVGSRHVAADRRAARRPRGRQARLHALRREAARALASGAPAHGRRREAPELAPDQGARCRGAPRPRRRGRRDGAGERAHRPRARGRRARRRPHLVEPRPRARRAPGPRARRPGGRGRRALRPAPEPARAAARHPGRCRAGGRGVAARDQARRLPSPVSPAERLGPARVEERTRLDRSLPRARLGPPRAPCEASDPRRRGRRLRPARAQQLPGAPGGARARPRSRRPARALRLPVPRWNRPARRPAPRAQAGAARAARARAGRLPPSVQRPRARERARVLRSRLPERGRGRRLEARRRAAPPGTDARLAEGQVLAAPGVRRRGLHRAEGRARRARGAAPRRSRRRRQASLLRQGRHRIRRRDALRTARRGSVPWCGGVRR